MSDGSTVAVSGLLRAETRPWPAARAGRAGPSLLLMGLDFRELGFPGWKRASQLQRGPQRSPRGGAGRGESIWAGGRPAAGRGGEGAPRPPSRAAAARTHAGRRGGGGRGPRGAGRADLLTSVCLGRGSAARQAPGARLEPDVPRRRSGRHRRGALARTGWRAHGRAGRRRLARRAGRPLGFGADPGPARAEEPPRPQPPAERQQHPAPGRAAVRPGTPSFPGGVPEPGGLSRGRGGRASGKPVPLPTRSKGQGLCPPPSQVCFLKFLCKTF